MYPRINITLKVQESLPKEKFIHDDNDSKLTHLPLCSHKGRFQNLYITISSSKCLYSKKYNIPIWLTQCFSHELYSCIFSEGLKLLIIKECSRIQTIYIDN